MTILSIEHDKYEQVGVNTTRHGGGGVFSRYGKEILNDDKNKFIVCGYEESFDNLSELDKKDSCLILDKQTMDYINQGAPIKDFIPYADQFDIVIHHRDSFAFNLMGMKAQQAYWSTFYDHTVSPANNGAFVYSYEQRLRAYLPTRVYKVQLGSFVPAQFPNIDKEDYIFICTRHDSTMDTNTILRLCIKNNIQCKVAGPILDNYPLMIDNKNTHYLGVISNEKKNELSQKARLYSCIQNWDTIFSISCVESMAYGTPVIARNRGCFKYLIKENINGFFYNDNEQIFLDIWEKSNNINREEVYNSAKKWSHLEMVKSFYNGFEDLLKN